MKRNSLAVALTMGLLISGSAALIAQTSPERFWLAGRYDGNRIIIYFDAVKFAGTVPKNATKIAYPVANGFFTPVGLPPDYVAQLQRGPASQRFKIGDRYDLLGDDGQPTVVTLSTLVGFESDEGVGNDSYMGALAIPERTDRLLFSKDYYAVRRHVEAPAGAPKPKVDPNAPVAGLDRDPVRFDVQTQIAKLVTDQMKKDAGAETRTAAEKIAPAFTVDRFLIANGAVRYFVWAQWGGGKNPEEAMYRLAGWISPSPTLHFVAVEPSDFSNNLRKYAILNVVDLGGGRTGIATDIWGGESRELRLMEYRDGVGYKDMRVLQSLSVGE